MFCACKGTKKIVSLQIILLTSNKGSTDTMAFTAKQLNSQILKLAIPSILASITMPLVGLVDTAIVGHISDAVAIGGIAVGSMLFDLLYWNFSFLRTGTGGMTAQAYGRQDEQTAANILGQSLVIALCAALFIWAIQWLFVTLVLALIPCSPGVASFARDYYFIRIWAAPATLSLLAIRGWLIGMQNAIAPMVDDLVVNVVNVIASFVLAFYTPLGALGVAYGTVIAQYTGLIVGVFLLLPYRRILRLIRLKACLQWEKLKMLAKLNGNLFIRSLCFMVIYVGWTGLATLYGDNELAVSSIMMKLLLLYSYFLDGFAYAGEALTGRFIGTQDRRSLSQVVKILFYWVTALGVVSTVVYGIWGESMVRLMTSDAAVIAGAKPYLFWMLLMPLISCGAFLWDGIYIGATRSREIRNAMFFSALGFVGTYYALAPWLGIQALYLGYFVHLIIRMVYLTIRWRKTEMIPTA